MHIFAVVKRSIKSAFYSEREKELARAFKNITGYQPNNLKLYILAMQHSSIARTIDKGFKESNERLEYLGDALLGAIVAEYLFARFPYKEEGFLTEIRSRIVNREVLNNLAKKIGIKKLVEYNRSSRSNLSHKSLYGDSLEALIGAVYLDLGFYRCKAFILNRLIANHYDIDDIVENNTNYKSIVIEWAQKENNEIRFDIKEIENDSRYKLFKAVIVINGKAEGEGSGLSKKKAEQNAAHKCCEKLKLI
ncbi:MAG: ribonuclease III [Cyclobacteriaceae bacterium]